MTKRKMLAFTLAAGLVLATMIVTQDEPPSAAEPETPTPTTKASSATPFTVGARERWRVPVQHEIVGLPATDALGAVVAAGRAEVIAVSNSGALQWRVPLDGVLYRAPRIDDTRVFLAGRRSVTALDRTSGAMLWSFATAAEGEPDDLMNRPLVVGDSVVVSTMSGFVRSLDRVTGALRWESTLPTATTAEPAAIDGVVALVGIGVWTGLDASTGAMRWSGDLGLIGTSSPVGFRVGERALMAVATDEKVVAVDAATGAFVWKAEADQSELFQVPVVVEPSELLVPDHWGRVTAFDAATGASRWKTAGAEAIAEFGEPVLVGPRTVVLGLDADGPRIATPSGAVALRPRAIGHGVARLSDGGLVVSTWGDGQNYLLAYDLDLGR